MKQSRITSSVSWRKYVKSMAITAIGAQITKNYNIMDTQKGSAPGDKNKLGIIVSGVLGTANLRNCTAHPDVVVTDACDVWKDRLDPIVAKFKNTCTGYTDYRELLCHKGLDAVIIGTPAHWHALQAIEAAEAGLDIYLQKPMTMHLGESIAVRNAVRKQIG